MKVNLFETRKLHLPAYIIVVDHATKSVVLSVRGTFSVQDAVTDLVCDSTGAMASEEKERHRDTRRERGVIFLTTAAILLFIAAGLMVS